MINPAIAAFLLEKKKAEQQPAQPQNSFGGQDALAVGLSGLGDAFSAAAGRNTTGAKDTLGIIQGGEKSRMDEIKNYFERRKAEADMAKTAAETQKLNSEASRPPKPEGLDEQLARQVAEGKMTLEQAYSTKNPGRNDMLDFRKEEAARKATEAQEKSDLEAQGKLDSKQKAYKVYETARTGVVDSLQDTIQGPILGRLPAFTEAQQTADGAVSAMAPVLKELFRVSGEGVFTDRDQALLLNMVPDRSDRPSAAAKKIKNIDKIVRAKLGIPEPGEAVPTENPQGGSGLTPEQRRARIAELKAKQGTR